MNKKYLWLITACLSVLMAFSVTASPLDGFDKAPVLIEMNKNQIKSLVSAPVTPVVVVKTTNSADKALLKLISTETMKTSVVHVMSLSKRLPGSKCGADKAYKPKNSQHLVMAKMPSRIQNE